MKENAMTPETVKTPPPLTPKDSLSVEVEGIRNRHGHGFEMPSFAQTIYDIKKLLSIVDELRKERDELKSDLKEQTPEATQWYIRKIQEQLATAQAEICRKDEAIEKALDVGIYPKETVYPDGRVEQRTERQSGFNDAVIQITERYEAALADGKEGGE